jgi:hypothetical protein
LVVLKKNKVQIRIHLFLFVSTGDIDADSFGKKTFWEISSSADPLSKQLNWCGLSVRLGAIGPVNQLTAPDKQKN